MGCAVRVPSAFAGLGHYVVVISVIGILVTLAAYPLVALAGDLPMGRFTRGLIGSQAVAISTRSSLATKSFARCIKPTPASKCPRASISTTKIRKRAR